MQQVLFEGPDLLVRATRYPDSPQVVVTFSPMVHGVWEPGPGFAEEPLNALSVSNVVFIAKWNHWWQSAGVPAALAEAQRWIAGCGVQRVSAYGSSMGAYGALMFAGDLACTHVLALGPQFSIDRDKVPFEPRWKPEAKRIRFVRDDMHTALQSPAEKFVLYDIRHPGERQHVALMQGPRLNKVPVPFAGHAIGLYLGDTGQLKAMLLALIDGALAERLPPLLAAARRERKSSPAWRQALLERLADEPHHRKLLISLATGFVKQYPRDRKFRMKLATALHAEARHEEARVHAEVACELSGQSLGTLTLLRKIVVAQGDRIRQRELTAIIVQKREALEATRSLAPGTQDADQGTSE